MTKLTIKQFSEWLGYDPETVSNAIEIVKISDPDGAYTHFEDMGEFEMAEVVESIYFEHGSLKDAIIACKEDLGFMNESKNDEDRVVFDISSSYSQGEYSGNYSNPIYNSDIINDYGKSWDEFSDEEKKEIKRDYAILNEIIKNNKNKISEIREVIKKNIERRKRN